MKEHKIDLSGFEGEQRKKLSQTIQKKAFELGYEWEDEGKIFIHEDWPYLFLWDDGEITVSDDKEDFEVGPVPEIGVSAFLCLPEPIEKEGSHTMNLQEFDNQLRELLTEIGKSGYQIDYVTTDWIETSTCDQQTYALSGLQYTVKS